MVGKAEAVHGYVACSDFAGNSISLVPPLAILPGIAVHGVQRLAIGEFGVALSDQLAPFSAGAVDDDSDKKFILALVDQLGVRPNSPIHSSPQNSWPIHTGRRIGLCLVPSF